MGYWTLAAVVAVLAVVASIVLMFRDPALPRRRISGPDWLIPEPRDLREPRFGFRWHGYDPAEVDVLLSATAVAWEEVLRGADPSALARAEDEVARRRGLQGASGPSYSQHASDPSDVAVEPSTPGQDAQDDGPTS